MKSGFSLPAEKLADLIQPLARCDRNLTSAEWLAAFRAVRAMRAGTEIDETEYAQHRGDLRNARKYRTRGERGGAAFHARAVLGRLASRGLIPARAPGRDR
jgi:hypothetical protein